MGAFVLIFDDRDRVSLCLLEGMNAWNLPGGASEREPCWAPVVREFGEETGLDAQPERLARVYWRPEQGEVDFAFVCWVEGGDLVETREAVEARNIALDAIPDWTTRRRVARNRDERDHPEESVMTTQLVLRGGSPWRESVARSSR